MSKPSKSTMLAIVATAALVGVSGPAAAGGETKKKDAGPSKAEVAKVRAATAKYRDVRKALAAGYVATPVCDETKAGAMGFHYIHPKLMSDRKVDVAKPEILLYGPKQGGGVQLNGVEYFVADKDQNLQTRDAGLPKPLGHEFDGPMPGHVPGMPVHNDLHVWVHTKNPKGLFAQWNPAVKC